MPANLSSFQSVMQLVAGANLAIFALPKLGQAEIEMEARRWESVIDYARRQSANVQILAQRGLSEFNSGRTNIDEKNSSVRQFALLVTLISSGYLVWMSCFPEGDVNLLTVFILFLGVVPALALFARNQDSRNLLKASREARSRIT